MRDIDAVEVRAELAERIRQLFSLPRGEFNAVLSPAGPYEVPDEVGDGRPLLVVMSHESTRPFRNYARALPFNLSFEARTPMIALLHSCAA